MKQLLRCAYSLIVLLFLCRQPLHAQSTMGTDFWLSFIIPDELVDPDSTFTLLIATDHTDTVSVSNPLLNWHRQITVRPRWVNCVNIPYSICLPNITIPVNNGGIHVSSHRPISLYASIRSMASHDIANVMPTPALRDDYIVQTYPNSHTGSTFTVVATHDSTTIDIQFLSNDTLHPTNNLTVFLPHAGNVYYFWSSDSTDYSGTHVHARENKRIAVFCGNPRAFVPEYNSRQSGDVTFDPCIPTSYWGKDYLVIPCGRKDYPDRLRITALYDDCQLTIGDSTVTTLSSRQTYEHCLASDSDLCHIRATQPILVGHYFASTYDGMSDPSLIFVPPLNLGTDTLHFACANTSMTRTHRAIVLVRTDALGSVRLDDNPVDSLFLPVPNGPGYHYARIRIDTGSHTLTSIPGNQFIAYLYGKGNHESYGYTAGYAIVNATYAGMFANGLDTRLFPHGFHLCLGDTLNLAIRSDFSIDTVSWQLDNQPPIFGDSIRLFIETPGQHHLSTHVNYTRFESPFVACNDTTIHFSIFVDTTIVTYRTDTVDLESIPIIHGGHTYYDNTTNDTLYFTRSEACDSIEIYSLSIRSHQSDEEEPQLWLPNTFTPGRENNNLFVVYTQEIIKADIAIFNRRGACVAHFDALRQCWDGTCRGVPCPMGTYVYRINYRTTQIPHSDQTKVGTVMLLR